MKHIIYTVLVFVFSLAGGLLHAQIGAEVELNKPAQYENRKLASEKTGEKKFTIPRRFIQNSTTHYNYYFNANNRLKEVVERAKASFKDDYSRMLPFYNYTLEATAQDKGELDSVIYKSTAGILLHDLRSDWVDNMYLLMAKAYFFRNDLDSANMTLQYLNYAFAPKEDGGYDIPIGSNSSNETGEFSIATKENNSLLKKMTGRPPSRNESFIWQIRSFIQHDDLPEAAGLIEILKNDPQFPKRLQTDLNEVIAHWFYQQQIYDSAAFYLSRALPEATNKQEKARWEYLVAQMYQSAGNNQLAVDFYNRSIEHTLNPVMDVYARLNALKINRGDSKDYQQENIDALVKMAKRDRYVNYRDIIYYAAATIELDRKNYSVAEDLLIKSTKYSNNNPQQRSESFLLLADMNYNRRKYTPASNYYDSTDINSLKSPEDKERVIYRKPPVRLVAQNEYVVYSQDSVQALAKLPANKRDEVIKRKVKELRKSQGIKEEEPQSDNPAVIQKQAADLFGDNSKNTDFYFYNASLKARGFSDFRAKWGQRPNVDNWRRQSAVSRQSLMPGDVDIVDVPTQDMKEEGETSYEGLLSKIPVTEEQVAESNKSIEEALYTLGKTFFSKLEDYPSAIDAYTELLRRFPNSIYKSEAMFNLVYAYQKAGDIGKSDEMKWLLQNSSDTSRWVQLIKNPSLAKQENPAGIAATRKYEQIYTLFIEGEFERAKREKRAADSIYGKIHWTPQLLYIESIYYIREKEDSTAIQVLTDLQNQFASNPMAEKAKTMIDVLKRRSQIEDYLTKLEVTRNVDQTASPVPVRQIPVVAKTPPVETNTIIAKTPPVETKTPIAKDTVVAVVQQPVKTPVRDTVAAAVVVQQPVKPAPKDTLPAAVASPKTTTSLPVETPPIVTAKPLVKDTVAVAKNTSPVVDKKEPSPLPKAIESQKPKDTSTTIVAKPITKTVSEPVAIKEPVKEEVKTPAKEVIQPPARDTAQAIVQQAPVTTALPPALKKDTIAAAPAPIAFKGFAFVPADQHYVVVVLDKVDQVYASEAKNAFNRFNREKFYSKPIEISSLQLDERFNLVLEGPFADANAAVSYVDEVRPQARSRILPWLTNDKYSFLVISAANLDVLKNSKDMTAYKQLLEQAFPGKF